MTKDKTSVNPTAIFPIFNEFMFHLNTFKSLFLVVAINPTYDLLLHKIWKDLKQFWVYFWGSEVGLISIIEVNTMQFKLEMRPFVAISQNKAQ